MNAGTYRVHTACLTFVVGRSTWQLALPAMQQQASRTASALATTAVSLAQRSVPAAATLFSPAFVVSNGHSAANRQHCIAAARWVGLHSPVKWGRLDHIPGERLPAQCLPMQLQTVLASPASPRTFRGVSTTLGEGPSNGGQADNSHTYVGAEDKASGWADGPSKYTSRTRRKRRWPVADATNVSVTLLKQEVQERLNKEGSKLRASKRHALKMLRAGFGSEVTNSLDALLYSDTGWGQIGGRKRWEKEVLDKLDKLVETSQSGRAPLTFEGLATKDCSREIFTAALASRIDASTGFAHVELHSDTRTLDALFALVSDEEGHVSLKSMERLDDMLQETIGGPEPLSYVDLIAPDGPLRLVRSGLNAVMDNILPSTRARAATIVSKEPELRELEKEELRREALQEAKALEQSVRGGKKGTGNSSAHSRRFKKKPTVVPGIAAAPEGLAFFLSNHFALLQHAAPEKRDDVMQGLLDIYELQRKPVKREFIPPSEGELPPEVSYSPMKPLGQEISHRSGILVNLFPPQRVVWGAYVDLAKVMRPLRAKSLVKRLRYRTREDIFYREP